MCSNKKIDIPPETEDRPHTPYEKQLLKNREWRAKNKEKTNKYRRAYYQKNKETIKEASRIYMKNFYDNNPDARLAHNDYVTAKRQKDNDKITTEEKEIKDEIRQTKKHIRDLMKQVAYTKSVMQHQVNLEEEIAKQQDKLNKFKQDGKLVSNCGDTPLKVNI